MQKALKTLNALVLKNSQSVRVRAAVEMVIPFLDHFGVPYETVDLLNSSLPDDLAEFPLIIIAHDLLDPDGKRLSKAGVEMLRAAISAGNGLVSFDTDIPHLLVDSTPSPETVVKTNTVTISGGHPVSKSFESQQTIQLWSEMNLAKIIDGEVIASGNGSAFISSCSLGKGRIVSWASMDWMHTIVLGPLGGLDPLFWRSLAWAARKPFVLRGFPPVVTMRIDDVAGWGGLWQRSPLYWVEDAIQVGFKPWLGLFIYNLTPTCVDDLRKMILEKNVTAFPHAFGRPPRVGQEIDYYYQDGLPLRSDTYDEFIYFDHHHQVPWSDYEAERGLDAVEEWYRKQDPLPMSHCALPHWYELGTNTCERIFKKWGAEILGKVMDADYPLQPEVLWPRIGPFRKFEESGECFSRISGSSGNKPVYYADYFNVGGFPFFNTVTEIRDDFGYEWAPDNDVEASTQRGIRQLRRALDSFAMASLFTHETDFIYKIQPERWADIISGVAKGIAGYHPVQMTLDDAGIYLRDVKSSRLRSCRLDIETGEILATLDGRTERETHLIVFNEEGQNLREELCEIPPFDGFIVTAIACRS
jgi:hypothetical protein